LNKFAHTQFQHKTTMNIHTIVQ